MVLPATTIILNSLALIAGTLAISLPIGITLAALITRTTLPLRRVFAFLLATLLLVPLYLQTGAWQAGFGLQGWFTVRAGVELLQGLRGAIWVHALAGTVWVALITAIGFRLVEPELEEEALLHVGPLSVFWNVTLRQASGAVGVAALWVAVQVAGEMTATDLFRVRTYAEEIYVAHAATGDLQAAAFHILPSITASILLVLFGILVVARLMPAHPSLSFRKSPTFELGKWRWPSMVLASSFLFVLLAIPLFNLVLAAGIQFESGNGDLPQSHWRIEKLLDMVFIQSMANFGKEFETSLLVSGLSACGAVLAAIGLAGFGGSGRVPRIIVYVAVAVCLALPGPLLGVAVIHLLGPFPRAYDSLLAPMLAIGLRTLPAATLITWCALRSVPPPVYEAARLQGAGPLTRLFLIAVPSRWPAVAVAWLVAFVVGLGDLAASQLVLVPGHETLANRVFDRLHSGAYDQVCGLFLALIAFFAALTLLGIWLLRLWQHQVAQGMLE